MKKLTVFFFMLVFTITIQAQDRVVHGVVHAFDSIPLIGVQIKIQSTKQVIRTDSLGHFTAFCNKGDKLKLRAEGFNNKNIKIPKNTKLLAINMKLKSGEKQLDYAIGYGYVSEKDRTTAVSNMDVKKYDYSKYNSIYDIIRSMGVQVKNGQVIVRGNKSFQGSSAALIVIDGIIADYSFLNSLKPIDIKRIDILKDGASSVYGSRGANGVVLIETIKGPTN